MLDQILKEIQEVPRAKGFELRKEIKWNHITNSDLNSGMNLTWRFRKVKFLKNSDKEILEKLSIERQTEITYD